ncbi:ECF transporter S component [Paenibacillus vulneris]|uniref:CD3073 family putative ECF transporter S component n=1 Tax=Paenibacillus vulneris TaxID=1133364 RepID=A0ABW3UNM9_9BACL|nr:CD3073 family putative ECF transporter S component [Paenibacillus sp. 32352]
MRNQKTVIITLGALAVAINVIAGTVVGSLKIPFLFLDTVGTIFMSALFGPLWGMLVGILTNLVLGVTKSYTSIPFAVVNAIAGLVVGWISVKRGYTLSSSVIAGIILGIVCPAVGSVIAIGVFGGLTGGAQDIAVLWLKQAGSSVFTAAFLPRLFDNLVDKILSAILVYYIIKGIPQSLLGRSGRTLPKRGGVSHEAK